MSRLRRLERDFVYADIAAVASLLEQLDADDVMARFGLELRLHELRLAAAQLDALPDETTASAALFFGGRPVLGSLGIESEFGGAALTKFQDLVAKMLAHESGSLGLRGVVPNKNASTLHVTNIVKGSFGFLLEEMQPQQTMLETPLKAAVDGATGLLDAFGKDDEEQFQTAVELIDDRVLGTARELFGLMQQNGATLRVVAGDIDRSFDFKCGCARSRAGGLDKRCRRRTRGPRGTRRHFTKCSPVRISLRGWQRHLTRDSVEAAKGR